MSIYATLWQLRFPRTGDTWLDCEWVDVFAQGVPVHIGTPTAGYGYEAGDPYGALMPPALHVGLDESEDNLRAVVFVTGDTRKGTTRAGQDYESPLLVLTGAEYAAISFRIFTIDCVMRSENRDHDDRVGTPLGSRGERPVRNDRPYQRTTNQSVAIVIRHVAEARHRG